MTLKWSTKYYKNMFGSFCEKGSRRLKKWKMKYQLSAAHSVLSPGNRLIDL